MMHGDDLYPTYEGISYSDDPEAYTFSQFFFTIFLMLFIYAMLNLMISLIMESYEESQVCTASGNCVNTETVFVLYFIRTKK